MASGSCVSGDIITGKLLFFIFEDILNISQNVQTIMFEVECQWSVVKRAGLLVVHSGKSRRRRRGGDRRRGDVVGSAVVGCDWWLYYGSWRESPPMCHSPQHQTCRIMLIYGDGWAALSTRVRPGPSKDLSLHKIKGGQGVCQTKANSEGQSRSWTERQPSKHRETPEGGISGSVTSASDLTASKFSRQLAGWCSCHDCPPFDQLSINKI